MESFNMTLLNRVQSLEAHLSVLLNWQHDHDWLHHKEREGVNGDDPREKLIQGLRAANEILRAQLAASAPPTTASPTEDSPSAAVEASTTQATQASSQSGQSITESGRAEPDSGCVHEAEWDLWATRMRHNVWLDFLVPAPPQLRTECRKCGASMRFALIPVPAAATTPWTYQKPDSAPFAVELEKTAPLASNESSEHPY